MKQRSRAAGQPVKARRARTVTPKRRKAPKAALGRGSAIANLQEQLDRRTQRDEALEHQTATSEVLQVIGSSMADAKPVFERIVDSIERLFACRQIAIFLTPGDGLLHMVAGRGIKMESLFAVYPLPIEQTAAPAVLGARQQVYYPDVLNGANVPQSLRRAAQVIGNFSDVLTPMLWERRGVGMIAVTREANTPYNSNELSLLRTFADQAVIAIENVRLFEAEQQRARELSESLEQQTATADVLKVISRSTFDLDAVLTTLTESARALCGAPSAVVWLRDGDVMRLRAESGCTPEFVDFLATHPVRAGRESFTGRVMLTGEVVHSPDVQADPDYNFGPAPKLGNFRAGLGVPLLREGRVEGVFTLSRPEPDAFSPRQIELIKAFADQAVIAIENARLLTELRQRTDELGRSVGELQALGEVSQAVNSTLDLETVLSTIVAKTVQISGTEAGAIYAFDNTQREFHLRATYGMDQELIDALANQRFGRDEPNIAQALAQLEPIQIADLREEAPNAINEITLRAGYRARLAAPLIRGEDVVGLLVVRRRTPGAFPQNIVDLIKTFAAQSAVAIENAHLFQNVEASLENLRTAQDRLVQTEKLASLGQLTAGIAHEIKNPLNFVNNFSAVSVELIDELRDALGGVHLDDKQRAEIGEIADMLQGNLDKVVQHGKRADSIVKNMLLHSRQGSGEHRPVDINAILDESLNLAYHGARAEKDGFNITLERSFDPAAGEVDLFPQEITRVLLNLISNGFYAATKRKAEANGGDYEPTLAAATKNLGDSVEISIRDNGTGIPPEVKEKLFNPFFTTKPAGEGTGLGLSISHDIIVKQHGGSIEVDTQPGEFTEFRIVLPRAGASLIRSGESA